MPSTHLSLHYHIVFSTKGRSRTIAEPWREELHAYIGGILRGMDAVARSIGGTGDHVHVLTGMKATTTLSEAVRQIKRGSSAWIHQHGVHKFAWQEGYGAFTVSPSHLNKVQGYIANQAEHHRKKTFEEEYLDLLRLAGVEFDEKYLW
ncbi:MAG TPA: IS200/IS605 family transposase [Terriglobia bacterium]|nr:IS200/IS605 family transposase [Terriglobia bacterium]